MTGMKTRKMRATRKTMPPMRRSFSARKRFQLSRRVCATGVKDFLCAESGISKWCLTRGMNGMFYIPPYIRSSTSIEDDAVVFAYTGNAHVLGKNVPKLGVVGVVHGVPWLVRSFGQDAD
jgi:hypothetical protein